MYHLHHMVRLTAYGEFVDSIVAEQIKMKPRAMQTHLCAQCGGLGTPLYRTVTISSQRVAS